MNPMCTGNVKNISSGKNITGRTVEGVEDQEGLERWGSLLCTLSQLPLGIALHGETPALSLSWAQIGM